MENEMLPEYNLKSMQVRRMGADRKQFAGKIIELEPDVVSVFHDAATVNAALRLFIKLTQENPLTAPQSPTP